MYGGLVTRFFQFQLPKGIVHKPGDRRRLSIDLLRYANLSAGMVVLHLLPIGQLYCPSTLMLPVYR